MSISVSPTTTTNYSVTVADGSCNTGTSITQNVSLCTSLNELYNNNSINVYPNPFNESFIVSWDSNNNLGEETQIFIYNTLGENVFTTKTKEDKININSKDWVNGTYFIRLNNKVYKIVK
jgi:hypothetical protein